MKTIFFILFTSVSFFNFAQFSTESQVVSYMSAKEFYSGSYQMTVSYEFIPKYNTHGIVCVNKDSQKFYYINCSVIPYGSSADINGMSSNGGGNFGFRLYEGRLSVQGEIFYLKEKVNYQEQNNSTVTNQGGLGTIQRLAAASKQPAPTTTQDIMKFQDWMDKNHPNWVNGKNLNKGKGYGSWGPSTEKAWGEYKVEYYYK